MSATGESGPYPLLLEPILLEKVWGGRGLERLGKRLPPGARIGESWELADLPSTSVSGAGGQAARSRIRNGPLAGRTLHEALEAWGPALVDVPVAPGDDFPLLVKFLDARENLSVQVHPCVAYAARHPECRVKHECWYVLAAEPGSVIYKGLRAGVDRARFAHDLSLGRVVENLRAVPARVGECHVLPSGTCHALGAGVMVAEVQTPSDTTFRLYDWGRQGRALHVLQALECLATDEPPPATRRPRGVGEVARLAETPAFALDEVITRGTVANCWHVLIVLAGQGMIDPAEAGVAADPRGAVLSVSTVAGRHGEGTFEPVVVARGDTVVVPAVSGARVRSGPGGEPLHFLGVRLAGENVGRR